MNTIDKLELFLLTCDLKVSLIKRKYHSSAASIIEGNDP